MSRILRVMGCLALLGPALSGVALAQGGDAKPAEPPAAMAPMPGSGMGMGGGMGRGPGMGCPGGGTNCPGMMNGARRTQAKIMHERLDKAVQALAEDKAKLKGGVDAALQGKLEQDISTLEQVHKDMVAMREKARERYEQRKLMRQQQMQNMQPQGSMAAPSSAKTAPAAEKPPLR